MPWWQNTLKAKKFKSLLSTSCNINVWDKLCKVFYCPKLQKPFYFEILLHLCNAELKNRMLYFIKCKHTLALTFPMWISLLIQSNNINRHTLVLQVTIRFIFSDDNFSCIIKSVIGTNFWWLDIKHQSKRYTSNNLQNTILFVWLKISCVAICCKIKLHIKRVFQKNAGSSNPSPIIQWGPSYRKVLIQ